MRSAGVAADCASRTLLEGRTPLCLKTRETASLALKRIFEEQLHKQQQQPSSSSMVANTSCIEETSGHVRIAHDQSQAMIVHPDLDLRLAPPSTSHEIIVNSLSENTNRTEFHDVGGTELTIVYRGNVCVYEGVSDDKVQAILLLASGIGSGLHKAKNPTTKADAAAARANANPPTPFLGYRQIHLPKSTSPPTATRKTVKMLSRSQAELPFARKASLSRFLEKRKERLEDKVVAADNNDTDSLEPPQKRLITLAQSHQGS